MLFVKYQDQSDSCIPQIRKTEFKKINKMRSLQAQAVMWWQKRKRASRFASCEVAVTVEAALVLPVFLSAVCGLLLLGSLLLTETKIQYALARTADLYAAQKAVDTLSNEKKSTGAAKGEGADGQGQKRTPQGAAQDQETVQKQGSLSAMAQEMAGTLLTKANLQILFASVYENSSMDDGCIQGGRGGIRLSEVSGEGEEIVELRASYRLKIELPFVGEYAFDREAGAVQRIFSGYMEGGAGEGAETGRGGVVYVTKSGSVYHTSLSCSHICLRISGSSVEKILTENRYQACEKCIHDGEIPAALYVTKYGDKYHASLGCSGLKRTVRTIPREDAEGMRMCSRCAALERQR